MAKTKAQIEKRKRETEKRKQTEKAILKKAAEMPDDDEKPGPIPRAASGTTKGKP